MLNQDLREQICNSRKTGTFAEVQLPLERITTLHGILIDLDPKLYLPGNPIFPPSDDPEIFHRNIRPVLDRHPLARHAEVRASGTGLHLIVQLDPPVELTSEADQRRWDDAVRSVQCSLPSDVNAPGITALTRPVGSINSKNGGVVKILHPGQPVNPRAVEEYVVKVAKAHFKEVASVLLGGDRIRPCPVCHGGDSRLDVLTHVGMCYGECGKVKLEQIYDSIHAPAAKRGRGEASGSEEANAASSAPAEKTKQPRVAKSGVDKGLKKHAKSKTSKAGGRAARRGKPDR